jgi:protein-tyrosine phosphatase
VGQAFPAGAGGQKGATPMTITEITPGVYVGDESACEVFDGPAICVADTEIQGHHCLWIPILTYSPPLTASAKIKSLDRVTAAMRVVRKIGSPVMVHCSAGIERSPLAVAWYLHKERRISFDEAYDFVLKKHTAAQDRRYLIPNRWRGRKR